MGLLNDIMELGEVLTAEQVAEIIMRLNDAEREFEKNTKGIY